MGVFFPLHLSRGFFLSKSVALLVCSVGELTLGSRMRGGWVRRSVEKSQELHRIECFQKLGIISIGVHNVEVFCVVFSCFSPSQGYWMVMVVGVLRHSIHQLEKNP